MTKFRDQSGQTLVLSVLFLTVLLGMAALVIDVGSWYRADRAAQTTADAAALAAAQALPGDRGYAIDLAVEYGDKNDKDVVEAEDVTFSTKWVADDTVHVKAERPTPGFFAKLFGVDSVQVAAKAAARTGTPAAALYVAPIVVNEEHPMLKDQCFGNAKTDESNGCDTELEYYHLKEGAGGGKGGGKPEEPDGAGSFGFISLDQSDSNPGTSTLGDWIRNGYNKNMYPGDYQARTGNPFSSSHVGDALADKMNEGEELLFPIYRKLIGTGSGAQYVIVGWAAFHITKMDLAGSNEKLYGYFTDVNWQGVQGSPGSSYSPGVRVVELVD